MRMLGFGEENWSAGGDVRAMQEFLYTVAEYQHYWIPLLVGMGVGVLMIATGTL